MEYISIANTIYRQQSILFISMTVWQKILKCTKISTCVQWDILQLLTSLKLSRFLALVYWESWNSEQKHTYILKVWWSNMNNCWKHPSAFMWALGLEICLPITDRTSDHVITYEHELHPFYAIYAVYSEIPITLIKFAI